MPKNLVFNEYQKNILENYENGEFSNITTQKELDDCGDGLLRFLIVELSDSEDCESPIDAVGRVATAINQLQNVKNSLASHILCNPSHSPDRDLK